VQTRIGIAKEEARYQGGAVGKLWIEPARLLCEGFRPSLAVLVTARFS